MKTKINSMVFSLMVMSFCLCGSLSAEVIDRIVALVDDDIVTLVQLKRETAPYLKNIAASGYPDEKKKQLVKDINDKVLNALIDRSLTQQEAKKYRINVSKPEIDNAVENVLRTRSLSREEFLQALAQEGLALEEYRENIKKQILQAKLINHAVKSKVIITNLDIKKAYENDAEKYSGKKQHHLRNILMDNEDEINKIKIKLNKNEKFTVLAKEYSMAPNAQDDGDLGVFDIDNFSKNIKDSISNLNKGGYTDVISTAQGFQIFYVDDIVLIGQKTYEQAHDEIYNNLYNKAVEKKFKTWLESLKKKAHIKKMI